MTIYNTFKRELYDLDSTIKEHNAALSGNHDMNNELALQCIVEGLEKMLLFVDLRSDNLKESDAFHATLLMMIEVIEKHEAEEVINYESLQSDFEDG